MKHSFIYDCTHLGLTGNGQGLAYSTLEKKLFRFEKDNAPTTNMDQKDSFGCRAMTIVIRDADGVFIHPESYLPNLTRMEKENLNSALHRAGGLSLDVIHRRAKQREKNPTIPGRAYGTVIRRHKATQLG